MNFMARFGIALGVILAVTLVFVSPIFIPYLFGMTGGPAVALIAGIYLVIIAAVFAAVADDL
jgi:hypothetical protein